MKKNNIFKKDYYKKYKNLREMISSRAKDSGYNFKQSYIKNIKKLLVDMALQIESQELTK